MYAVLMCDWLGVIANACWGLALKRIADVYGGLTLGPALC